MFCHRCGTRCLDEATFCHVCGGALLTESNVTPAPQPAPVNEPQAATQPTPEVQSSPVAVETAKKQPTSDLLSRIVTSPLYLISIIFFTCYKFYTILQPLLFGFRVSSTPSPFFGYIDYLYRKYTDFLYGYWRSDLAEFSFDFNYDVAPFSYFPGILITLLTIAGLWILFICCKAKKKPVPTAGLTMLKTSAIIQLCIFLLTAFLLSIMNFIILIANGIIDGEFACIMACLVIMLLLTAAIILTLIAFIKFCATISAAKRTFKTDTVTFPIPKFAALALKVYGIICFLSASNFWLYRVIISIANGYSISFKGILQGSTLPYSLFISLLGIAYFIFGMLLSKYRQQAEEFTA